MIPSVQPAALAYVKDYCDIERRLRAVPPSARVRGMGFGVFREAARRADQESLYDELTRGARFKALHAYPLGEYLVLLALAGALVAGREQVLQGIFEVSRHNARAYADSLLGRTLIRLLAHDPVRLSEQGLAMRRHVSLYGHWELLRRGPRELEMCYRDEYIWIEHALAGAAQGTFEACGLHPQIETRLDEAYNGATIIRW
jgi:uncharacterized protein (TIGR02265 family)